LRRIDLTLLAILALYALCNVFSGVVASESSEQSADQPTSYFAITPAAENDEQETILAPLLYGHAKEEAESRLLFGGVGSTSSPILSIQHLKGSSRFHADVRLFRPFRLRSQFQPTNLLPQDNFALNLLRPTIDNRVPDRPVLRAAAVEKRPDIEPALTVQEPKLARQDIGSQPLLDSIVDTSAPSIHRRPINERLEINEVPVPSIPVASIPVPPISMIAQQEVPKRRVSKSSGEREKPVNTMVFVARKPAVNDETLSTMQIDQHQPVTEPTVEKDALTTPQPHVSVIAETRRLAQPHSVGQRPTVPTLTTDAKLKSKFKPPAPNLNDLIRPELGRPFSAPMPKTAVEALSPEPREEVAMTWSKSATNAEFATSKAPKGNTSVPLAATPKPQSQAKMPIPPAHSSNTISWDQWYLSVAKLCDPLLVQSIEKHGNASGSNRIQITVWSDHRLSARLVRGQSDDFDRAVLEAYSKLDGNQALEFPAGSKRHKVSFYVDNSRRAADDVSGITSHSIVGDSERF